MSFQMMDGDNGFIQRKSQGIGVTRPRQQRTAQTWALGKGNCIDVAIRHSNFLQATFCQRNQSSYMVAACQFRHNTAILGVHCHLRMQMMCQKAALRIIKRDTSFVT